ncbi:putative glutathione S-transferase [Bradyrhizobium sp. ORS 278]|uniref:glutathione S-transferase family protein n=1 Tax=Bradyrhizobium sp. (strain ORS 278) TaxID=114615 RepID=UPI0001508593|nr:glutathione S-transferase family protein [Bradyrhizobium sp. ORS 278]CAL78195.1 putative glutathione S-transferase [Bradyrhizobium sp. ORS 278]
MKIYWIKAQAPRRVLALVKHLGVPAEFIDITGRMKTEDYAALNPNMKAPVLVDGGTVLWESTAIMAHLCVRESCDMWPSRDPREQVEVLRWLAWTDSHWNPAVAPFYFEHIVRRNFNLGAPDRASLVGKVANLKTFASVLDAHLRAHGHIACDRLTIADFAAASMAADWREAEMPLDQFPNIGRWLDGLMRLPAWAEPWPEQRSAAA